MPLLWADLRVEAIRAFVRSWIDPQQLDANAVKQVLVDYLDAHDFSPQLCFSSGSSAPPPLTVRPKFEIQPQQKNEHFDHFVRRLEIFFTSANVLEQDKPALLMANLHPDFAEAAATAFDDGNRTYATLSKTLATRFATPPLLAYHNFLGTKRRPEESVKDFAGRLRVILARVLNKSVAEVITDHTAMFFLNAQLHEGLTGFVKGYVAELVQVDPAPDFTTVVDKAHHFDVAHPAKAYVHSKQTGDNKPDKHKSGNGLQGSTTLNG